MIIKRSREETELTVDQMEPGETFVVGSCESRFMKLAPSRRLTDVNAVRLSDGEPMLINTTRPVTKCVVKDKEVKFRDLDTGDVFRLPCGERLYIKVFPISGHAKTGSIKLDDGGFYDIEGGKEVVPIRGVFNYVSEDCYSEDC